MVYIIQESTDIDIIPDTISQRHYFPAAAMIFGQQAVLAD
jgi:hypothetical protein